MAKLTDTQQLVLVSASKQEAGCAIRPEKLNTTAAGKVAASLIDRGYMRECGAKPGSPIWRKDGLGKPYSLKILKAGRVALKAFIAQPAGEASQVSKPITAATPHVAVAFDTPRASSKIAGILVHLDKAEGATANEMISATGWLPHTLRAALTGLRKRGYVIERIRKEDGASAYRLGRDATIAAVARS